METLLDGDIIEAACNDTYATRTIDSKEGHPLISTVPLFDNLLYLSGTVVRRISDWNFNVRLYQELIAVRGIIGRVLKTEFQIEWINSADIDNPIERNWSILERFFIRLGDLGANVSIALLRIQFGRDFIERRRRRLQIGPRPDRVSPEVSRKMPFGTSEIIPTITIALLSRNAERTPGHRKNVLEELTTIYEALGRTDKEVDSQIASVVITMVHVVFPGIIERLASLSVGLDVGMIDKITRPLSRKLSQELESIKEEVEDRLADQHHEYKAETIKRVAQALRYSGLDLVIAHLLQTDYRSVERDILSEQRLCPILSELASSENEVLRNLAFILLSEIASLEEAPTEYKEVFANILARSLTFTRTDSLDRTTPIREDILYHSFIGLSDDETFMIFVRRFCTVVTGRALVKKAGLSATSIHEDITIMLASRAVSLDDEYKEMVEELLGQYITASFKEAVNVNLTGGVRCTFGVYQDLVRLFAIIRDGEIVQRYEQLRGIIEQGLQNLWRRLSYLSQGGIFLSEHSISILDLITILKELTLSYYHEIGQTGVAFEEGKLPSMLQSTETLRTFVLKTSETVIIGRDH